MKKLMLLVIFLFSVISTSYAAKMKYQTVRETTVYAEQSVDSKVRGTLDAGVEVERLGFENGMAKIKFKGKDGYVVSSGNLTIIKKKSVQRSGIVNFFYSILKLLLNVVGIALTIGPIYALMRVRRLTNFQVMILAAAVPLLLMYLYLFVLKFCGMYDSITYTYVYWGIVLVLIYLFLSTNIDERCPQCHYHKGVLTGGKRENGDSYKVTETDSRGRKSTHYETEVINHSYYKCPECQHEWTVKEKFKYTGRKR